jgi:hypothetical protein
MGGQNKTGNNLTHDTAILVAESSRQAVVNNAASSAAGQAAVNAAEIAWARAVIASAKANNSGFGVEPATTLLKSLGTGGS